MLYLLVGHRGVGKSTLLKRLAATYALAGKAAQTYDLDQRISDEAGLPIAELFSRHGEAAFRAREEKTLRELLALLDGAASAVDIFIALGAGFCGELPQAAQVVWVRRTTDEDGRIFVSDEHGNLRPRLEPELSPLDEYQRRFPSRQERYRAACHLEWTLPEGLDEAAPASSYAAPSQAPDFAAGEAERVRSLLFSPALAPPRRLGGVLSLLGENFRHGAAGFGSFITRRLGWSATRFELRDDLLDDDQLALARAAIPAERRIYSFRRRAASEAALAVRLAELARDGSAWDYPLELGAALAPPQPPILSLHERQPGESVAAAAERLTRLGQERGAQLLKLAVVVENLAQLEVGARWAQAEPQRRVFLPRSPADGGDPARWRWYRLLTGRRSPLCFVREGDGTGLDQPLLAEWWGRGGLVEERFAAVLGQPVRSSRTPAEQQHFFSARRLLVLAISVGEDEWQAGALDILWRLGLRYAAVTAPLKRQAAALIADGESDAINTLYFDERQQRWRGTNTDPLGAAALLQALRSEAQVAVWGGGGTLPALLPTLPQARYFSARSGLATSGAADSDDDFRPQALVWAVGRSRQSAARWPDPRWRPTVVYDLNYGEDSPGREYAQRIAARYVSGLAMFRAQAAAQRQFWSTAEST